jgi:hypothetical protein
LRLAIAVDINHEHELVIEASFNQVLFPQRVRQLAIVPSWILVPSHSLAEPGAGHNVYVAVSVDI